MAEPEAPAATGIYVPPSNIPPPKPLVFDDNIAISWKTWQKAWKRFEIATGVYKQDGVVRVSTLLSIIGEDGVKTFDTFTWAEGESEDNIDHVLKKFDEHCEPRTQVIYERYRFNNRKQEQGENVSTYLTELRTIARNCDHESITPDEILRDRLVLGIRDDKVRERLLRTDGLSLKKAVEIVKAAEQTQQQVKIMTGDLSVNTIKENKEDTKPACTKRRNVETKRPKRNGRNDRNETAETKQPKRNGRNETTETKRPKRNDRNETAENINYRKNGKY